LMEFYRARMSSPKSLSCPHSSKCHQQHWKMASPTIRTQFFFYPRELSCVFCFFPWIACGCVSPGQLVFRCWGATEIGVPSLFPRGDFFFPPQLTHYFGQLEEVLVRVSPPFLTGAFPDLSFSHSVLVIGGLIPS